MNMNFSNVSFVSSTISLNISVIHFNPNFIKFCILELQRMRLPILIVPLFNKAKPAPILNTYVKIEAD